MKLAVVIANGTQDIGDVQEIKRVRLTNLIALLFSAFAIFYIIFFGALGFWNYVPFLVLIFLGYASPLWANKKGWFALAKASLVFWCNIGGLVFGLAFGQESAVFVVMVGFSCIPFLFYDISKITPIAIGSGFSIVAAFAMYFQVFGPWETVPENVLPLISGTMLATAFIIVWLSLRYLAQENNQAVIKLVNSYSKLKKETHQKEDAISEQRRLVAVLQQKNADLDEFAYIIAHDLKAPLAGIQGVVSFLKEDLAGKSDEQTESLLDMLHGRAVKLQDLVDGILEYSRAGREKNKFQELDVSELFAEVTQRVRLPEGFRIEKEIKTATVNADALKLMQCVQNLLSNAINHNDKGDEGKVLLRSYQNGEFVCIEVSDNGPGIAQEFQQQIFKLFATLDLDKPESTGVGLAIVKKMTESQGGKIQLASQLKAGSRFTIALPVKKHKEPILERGTAVIS